MTTRERRESRHEIELPVTPAEALDQVAQAVEVWGGDWQRDEGADTGRLGLPVMAGLRRGWIEGRLEAHGTGDDAEATRLVLTVDGGHYRLEAPSVAMLVLAALGAVVTLVAPFVPALWPLVPIGVIVALASWLFIVARLRNSGPDELFALLAEENRRH